VRSCLVLAVVAGCLSPAGCSHDTGVTPVAQAPDGGTLELRFGEAVKADVLLVIDDLDPGELFPVTLPDSVDHLLAPFRTRAARGVPSSIHLGVITSNLGAGATSAPGCTRGGGGDGGRLVAQGKKAAADCLPPVAANYLDVELHGDGSEGGNVPPGRTVDETLRCMSSVGAGGCGFRHLLEATRQALGGSVPENAGFLRDDAALAAVFITDSDDCSAPPDSPLFDKNRTAEFGYESTFRCRRFGIECGDPPMPLAYDSSHGPLSGCRPAPQPLGLLFDTTRYVDWFGKPASAGGLKSDPADVVLYALDGDPQPFEVVLSNPGTVFGMPFTECPRLNESSNPPCVPVMQFSCMSADSHHNTVSSLRLESVVQSVPLHGRHSWCDPSDHFASAFDEVARLLITRFSEGCLSAPGYAAVDPRGGLRADCTVRAGEAGALADVPACDGSGRWPCWRVAADVLCAPAPLSARLFVDRTGPPPPVTQASCRLLPP